MPNIAFSLFLFAYLVRVFDELLHALVLYNFAAVVVAKKIIINCKESGDLAVKAVIKEMQQIAVEVIDDSVGLCQLSDLRFAVIKGDDLFLAGSLLITGYQPSAPFHYKLGFRYAGLLKVKASDNLILSVEHGIAAHLLCALKQPVQRDS